MQLTNTLIDNSENLKLVDTINQIIELASNKEFVSRWNNFCKKLQIKNLQFNDIIIMWMKNLLIV